jgi:hypothetical protein
MTRPPTLTDRQIQIIRENLDLFPADILKLPEFTDTDVTRHTIRNYQRRLKNAAVIDEEEDLLTRLKQYINRYGLESRFHGPRGVTGFISHLENRIRLRANPGGDRGKNAT